MAKSKGVHREVESEESWRQNSGLTNKNHIRLQLGIRSHNKSKSNNYSELTVVNVADGWSERLRSYLGRSRQRVDYINKCIRNPYPIRGVIVRRSQK